MLPERRDVGFVVMPRCCCVAHGPCRHRCDAQETGHRCRMFRRHGAIHRTMFRDYASRHSLYPAFESAYAVHRRQRYRVDPGAAEHVTRCPTCGHDTLVTEIKQQRSADEEGTEVVHCLKCEEGE